MNKRFEEIRNLIQEGHTQEAIRQLHKQISSYPETAAESYYLIGNAYRKEGNWQYALNNYQEAIELNPESPAREAYRMVMDILNFYNKDMFNQ